MALTKFPTYTYFGSETFQTSLFFLCEDQLYDFLMNLPASDFISGDLWRQFSGNLEKSPHEIVNQLFGYNLLNKTIEHYVYKPSDVSLFENSFLPDWCNDFAINYKYIAPANNNSRFTKIVTLNNFTYNGDGSLDAIADSTYSIPDYFRFNDSFYPPRQYTFDVIQNPSGSYLGSMSVGIHILPESIWNEDGEIDISAEESLKKNPQIVLSATYNTDLLSPSGYKMAVLNVRVLKTGTLLQDLYYKFNGISQSQSGSQDYDISNPYAEIPESTVRGGDGRLGYGALDSVDPTAVPDLPTLSAADTGFVSLFNPSAANLRSLYDFLWSNLFDLATFKKLFADPMECIISLGVLPCCPSSSGSGNIKFGNVDTGINSTTLNSQFAQVDCGSVSIEKFIGSFMDYSPYVKINLFLPFVGFVHLGVDDLMGGDIEVVYNVDCLSGDCIAFVSHSEKGVLYSYAGNCRAEIPVTGQNYANGLRNYYESVAGIIPNALSGASGGAAGAAAGALGGALNVASNLIFENKPAFQRSGSLAGSGGQLGVKTPFIVIERPNVSVAGSVGHFVGQTSNITMTLGDCSGFTTCEYVHLDGLNATSEEITEIESMLKGGVIL